MTLKTQSIFSNQCINGTVELKVANSHAGYVVRLYLISNYQYSIVANFVFFFFFCYFRKSAEILVFYFQVRHATWQLGTSYEVALHE